MQIRSLKHKLALTPARSHALCLPRQVLGSESALVDDITTPGGVRALPDPADLRRFVDTASSMDGLRIAEVLREKMVGVCRGCVLVRVCVCATGCWQPL